MSRTKLTVLLLTITTLLGAQPVQAQPAAPNTSSRLPVTTTPIASAVTKTVLLGTWMWDIESNAFGAEREHDLWWEQIDGDNRALVPTVGIAVLGQHKLTDIGLKELAEAKYERQPVSGAKLRPGTVLAIQTVEGNLAKVRVLGYRALHDFDFPEAAKLDGAWREFVRKKPNTKEYHLEVEWVLYEQPASPKEEADLANEIRQLCEQRVKVAQEHYDDTLTLYKSGRIDFEMVFKAEILLRQAAYDAATTHQERVKALEAAVTTAQQSYELAKQRVAGGTGGRLELHLAEYGLLSSKLKLAEEKQRRATSKSE